MLILLPKLLSYNSFIHINVFYYPRVTRPIQLEPASTAMNAVPSAVDKL